MCQLFVTHSGVVMRKGEWERVATGAREAAYTKRLATDHNASTLSKRPEALRRGGCMRGVGEWWSGGRKAVSEASVDDDDSNGGSHDGWQIDHG